MTKKSQTTKQATTEPTMLSDSDEDEICRWCGRSMWLPAKESCYEMQQQADMEEGDLLDDEEIADYEAGNDKRDDEFAF